MTYIKSRYLLTAVFIPVSVFYILMLFSNLNKNLPSTCKNCNIIIIDIDSLRADALPCYGYNRDTMPNLCRFARKSLIFKNNYAPAPWTLPSIISTITSLYPTFHGVRINYIDSLSKKIPTIAKSLKSAGYKTAYLGKPDNQSVLTERNGGLQGYDRVLETNDEDLNANEAVQLIKELSQKNQPWFVHYYVSDIHMPYLLPENAKPIDNFIKPPNLPLTKNGFDLLLNKYLQKHYAEVFTPDVIKKYELNLSAKKPTSKLNYSKLFYKLCNNKNETDNCLDPWSAVYNTYIRSIDTSNPSHLIFLRLMYDSDLKLLDHKMDGVFKLLDSVSNNTIVIIMSDHGEAFGEHGVFSHDQDYHTELYHTPLIIRSPNIKSGQSKLLTSNIDIYPTILSLINLLAPDSIQGEPLIVSNKTNRDDKNFIVSEDYKGGIILQNPEWLYYLSINATDINQSVLHYKIDDPKEEKNVYNQYPRINNMLYNRALILRSYNKIVERGKNEPAFPVNNLSPEKIKRMQKEGYF